MQQDNKRLIDEASQDEAVKNTFRLGWEFIRLNQTFTLTVMGILIFLNFLGMILGISLVTSMLAGVFGIVLQIYAGRAVYESQNIHSYVELIEKSRIDNESLKRHFSTAFGVYMGWVVLIFIFLFTISIAAVSSGLISADMSQALASGGISENVNPKDMVLAFASIILPLALISLVVSYVQPLVHSNIVLANDFFDGFQAVFTIFSKDVWSSAMQRKYFSYVAVFGLFMMLCILPIAMVVTLLNPGVILNLLLVIVSYVLMIILSIGAMIARRIVEE